MRRIVPVLAIAIAMWCLSSCNEKPKDYRFVKKMKDGTEQVEKFEAKNDTDALNLYLDRMSAAIMSNLEKKQPEAFEAMYVISPDGDTLNTDKALLKSVMERIEASQPKKPAVGDTIILGTIPAKSH
jgi:hypothetical protein